MAGAQMSDVGDLGVPFLRGKRCEDFHYLSQTGTTRTDAIDDERDFKAMHSGLASSGLDASERIATYQVIGALLHLGQVALEADESGDACRIVHSAQPAVQQVPISRDLPRDMPVGARRTPPTPPLLPSLWAGVRAAWDCRHLDRPGAEGDRGGQRALRDQAARRRGGQAARRAREAGRAPTVPPHPLPCSRTASPLRHASPFAAPLPAPLPSVHLLEPRSLAPSPASTVRSTTSSSTCWSPR